MPVPIFQVDAFTDTPFAGNPAAVCLLDGPAEPGWMQAVAAEMNLAETAFLHPLEDGYGLRWFTPAVEVALCGHATLASAHVLWEVGRAPADRVIAFHTHSGRLTARCDGRDIELDFPAKPVDEVEAPPGLLEALVVEPSYVGRNQLDYLVAVDDAATVRALAPDLARLRALPVRGVIVTSPSDDPGYDFISRFFAPGSGIDEDPVTGSSHCALGPFWAERLGRTRLEAYQASPRGGRLRVTVDGDRVKLAGRAVTVLQGSLLAQPRPA
jgi:predicted PhzF superfamily epimerase YddE/YHI9